MAVGKASIQRAASAGKTKTAVIPNPAEEVKELSGQSSKESAEKAPSSGRTGTKKTSAAKTTARKTTKRTTASKTVKKPAETPKFIPEEEKKNRPVQVTEKLPIYLL